MEAHQKGGELVNKRSILSIVEIKGKPRPQPREQKTPYTRNLPKDTYIRFLKQSSTICHQSDEQSYSTNSTDKNWNGGHIWHQTLFCILLEMNIHFPLFLYKTKRERFKFLVLTTSYDAWLIEQTLDDFFTWERIKPSKYAVSRIKFGPTILLLVI